MENEFFKDYLKLQILCVSARGSALGNYLPLNPKTKD